MPDVVQGLVRVQPARLKELKGIISRCDREIQDLRREVARCNSVLNFRTHDLRLGEARQRRDAAIAQIAKLDAKRKSARLEAQGYSLIDRCDLLQLQQ